jgi:hypothetical protein
LSDQRCREGSQVEPPPTRRAATTQTTTPVIEIKAVNVYTHAQLEFVLATLSDREARVIRGRTVGLKLEYGFEGDAGMFVGGVLGGLGGEQRPAAFLGADDGVCVGLGAAELSDGPGA